MSSLKLTLYKSHVQDCRACTRCGPEMKNIPNHEHPSPWAQWMGNIHAKVVVVGQDFASQNLFTPERAALGPELSRGTNHMLEELICESGLLPSDVYLTNTVLCLKPGAMNAPLRAEWLKNCEGLLKTTIEIVDPLAVVALGSNAWKACCSAFCLDRIQLGNAAGNSPTTDRSGRSYFAMYHTSPQARARRSISDQRSDWRNLGEWVRTHECRRVA